MKKSFSVIIIAIMLICLFAMCFTACNGGKYKMTDFVVSFDDFAKTYEIGDEIDFSTIKMYATFSDESQEVIPLEKVSIKVNGEAISLSDLAKITETEGSKVIEIKYSEYVKTVTIRVNKHYDALLTGVRFDATDVAKTYNIGEDVSMSGLKVWAIYDGRDETSIALTDSDLRILLGEIDVTSNLNRITEAIGTKTIYVRYKTQISADPFEIVVNDVLTNVVINVPNNYNTNYRVGETISVTGITASATYQSGAVVNDVEVKFYLGDNEANLSTVTSTKGNKTITAKATHGETVVTKNITFTVENFVTAIAVDTTGAVLNYVQNDSISLASFNNVSINVTYADTSDNTSISLGADGVSCVNSNDVAIEFSALTTTPGQKPITVKYAGCSSSFTVNVVAADSSLETLTISHNPDTTSYTAGDTGVSFAGLEITGEYKAALSRPNDVIAFADFATYGVQLLYNDVEITNYDNLTKVAVLGENTVEVKVLYLGKTVSIDLTVNNAITGIEIDTASTSLEYRIKDPINFTNLKTNLIYNYGSSTLTGLVDGIKISYHPGDEDIDVTDELDVLTDSLSASRTVKVTYTDATYGSFNNTFNLSVIDYTIGISARVYRDYTAYVDITEGAKKTTFENLFVTLDYKSGRMDNVTNDVVISNNGIEEPETKLVTLTYGSYTDTISLHVIDILQSIEVTNIPTGIVKNGEVDLTSIVLKGTFSYKGLLDINILQTDGKSFLYGIVKFELKDDLDNYVVVPQTELGIISEKAGNRELKLTYSYYENDYYDEFVISIAERTGYMLNYSLPTSLVKYNRTLSDARTYQTDVDSTQFEGVLFANNEEDYLVGDDNPFKFVPTITYVDMTTTTENILASFKAISTITLIDGNNETVLTTASVGYTKSHKIDDTVYVIETTNENKYQFTAAAYDKKFKLSVLPDPSEFSEANSFNAVEWTVKVVHGYNVTDPKELCLLEQPSAEYVANNNRTHWNSIKEELGLTGKRYSSIILHNDLSLTADSIPSSMTYTFSQNYPIYYTYEGIKYRPEDVPTNLGGPLTRTFIYDELAGDGEYELFRYDMTNKESFSIHGNFFSIDMSKLPLVCPFEPTGIEMAQGYDLYYMPYMSKLSFLGVYGEDVRDYDIAHYGQCTQPTETPENDEWFIFDNCSVKGNSSPTELLVHKDTRMTAGQDNPVYGGGIILMKTHYCHANITNINAHTCFISFFSRNYTVVNYTNCKSYDTYLNGVFAHSETDVHMYNCHMKRAGGPLMILCHSTDDLDGDASHEAEYDEIPVVVADDDCVFECYVTGQEQWFAVNNAPIAMIQVLDAALRNSVGKTFQKTINGKTYFNLISVVIEEGSNPMGNSGTQGSMSYAGETMHKIAGDAAYEGGIKLLLDSGLPLVGIDLDMGGSNVMPVVAIDLPAESFDGWTTSYLVDPTTFDPTKGSINVVYQGANGNAGNIYNAFQTNHDYVVLYFGGFGILTGLWSV